MRPFTPSKKDEQRDQILVAEAIAGNRSSLEQLVIRHQSWIFNIVVRMTGHPQDAEDICQEIIIKVITHLASFRTESSFRTWLYRIVVNHLLNVKRQHLRNNQISFEQYGQAIDRTPDLDLPDPNALPVDLHLIVEETRISCMMGMLLCLDPHQRLVFILASIFGVSQRVGAAIMSTTVSNFRQQLCRARHQLAHFMDEKCGLIRPENPCHCVRKTRALIDAGLVDPHNLLFSREHIQRVHEVVTGRDNSLANFLEKRCVQLFRENPIQPSPDFVNYVKSLLDHPELNAIFELYH
ncbi:RNA polymerase sigma factor [bacterium]|nr:RNA polymerase sigma factor [bacterium]